MVDVLRQVTTWLDPDMVRSILDGVVLGAAHQVEVHDPAMVESDHCLRARGMCCCRLCAFTDACNRMDQSPKRGPSAVLDWLKAQKQTDLKALLMEQTSSKEGQMILQNQQNFVIHQGALYLHSMPKGKTKDLLLFVVPKAHWVATLNGHHRDAGHQSHDCTLSLLQECF